MSKENTWRSLRIVGIAGIAVCAMAFLPVMNGTPAESLQGILSPEQLPAGIPVRLTIPKIGVDAVLESVGLTPAGAMDVPRGPSDAAWFSSGPRPGENGTAVIDGHFGWKDGIPAVFDDLYKLQKGDTVSVKDSKGITTTFVVRELRTYGPRDNASDVFSSSDGKAHLNLITCEGVWDAVSRSYSKRLVVFTDKE